jgi:hypothetical protein
MRHRIGMILAAMMTGVLFFPGVWRYLRLLRFPVPAGQLGCGRAPAAVTDPSVALCDADGLAYDRAGIVVRPALVSVTAARPRAFTRVAYVLQHRRRCVSTVRWRASLTIPAGVVLIAAEGRAS